MLLQKSLYVRPSTDTTNVAFGSHGGKGGSRIASRNCVDLCGRFFRIMCISLKFILFILISSISFGSTSMNGFSGPFFWKVRIAAFSLSLCFRYRLASLRSASAFSAFFLSLLLSGLASDALVDFSSDSPSEVFSLFFGFGVLVFTFFSPLECRLRVECGSILLRDA